MYGKIQFLGVTLYLGMFCDLSKAFYYVRDNILQVLELYGIKDTPRLGLSLTSFIDSSKLK